MQQTSRPLGKIRPSTIVYWFRFALGALIAVTFMGLEVKGTIGIVIMVVVYVISYMIVRHGLKYGETELKGKHKAATLGIGTYIFTWAIVWILLYTLYPY
jgi:hypothetical protein